jgi:transposase
MKLSDLISIAGSEEKSEEFLRAKGILKTFKFCPFCGGKSIGRVRRKFFKCYSCRREWSVRKDSIFQSFLLAVKLFVIEVPVNRAYRELGIAYNVIYRFSTRDERVLLGEIEMDVSFRRKGRRGRGLVERRGKVRVEVVEDVSAESILRSAIKKVKRGSIIYTDRFRSYDGLVMYGFRHERIDHGKRFANGKVYINGIEGFWSYAKERLLKFHGVRREEFRYNNRDNLERTFNIRLFNILIRTIFM